MTPTRPDIMQFFNMHSFPFGQVNGSGYYLSSEYKTALKQIAYAVESYEVVAIAGDVGAGKSEAVAHSIAALKATEGMKVKFIRVDHPRKESVRINAVVESLLNDFLEDGERIPGSVQRRVWLLKFYLKQAVEDGIRVCLVIDEAHRLTGPFLKSLKDLYETIRFAHHGSLFAIVLTGHRSLIKHYKKVAPDVWQRLEAGNIAILGEMTEQEVADYILHRCEEAGTPGLFTEHAALAVGRLAKAPLGVNNICWDLLAHAYKEGFPEGENRRIDEMHVLSAYDPAQLMAMLDLSQGEIAKRGNLGKTTVKDVLDGKAGSKSVAEVKRVLAEAVQEGV